MADMRLDKLLASQGTESRAQIKNKIKKGGVSVNGEVVKSPDIKVDPDKDTVEVNGKKVTFKQYIYIMMNKPAGVVSAAKDRADKTVIDILPENLRRKGLFPAGRLDKDTEGLIIITDDGDFAHRMTSPNKGVYKKYFAVVDGEITPEDVKAFEQGIEFADGTRCLPARLTVKKQGENPEVFVEICEGKFHQVKKMFLSRGKKVVFLKRIQIGTVMLDGNLNKGECRELSKLEISNILLGKID